MLVVLLGHGTFDGDVAKFNLVGPDLTAADWTLMLTGLPGRLVVVNTTEASFPFLEALKAKGRVVITATNPRRRSTPRCSPSTSSRRSARPPRTSTRTAGPRSGRCSRRRAGGEAALRTARPADAPNGRCSTTTATAPAARQGADGPDGGFARLWNLDAEPAAVANNPELAALMTQQPHARGRGRGAEAEEGRDAAAPSGRPSSRS